jgi:DNA replication protein
MQRFDGFPAGKNGSVQVPNRFFSDLLPLIDDLAELKVTVYCFWALQQREGQYRYVRLRDVLRDETFMGGVDVDPGKAAQVVQQALERATARGTLLHVVVAQGDADEHLYFMNTERGRKAVTALEKGHWIPGDNEPVGAIIETPNIFALYEANIGPLTPLLSDILRDAEVTYPAAWIVDAMRIAVENNKRSWRYIEAILKRWAMDGRQDQPTIHDNAHEQNPYLRDEYFRRPGNMPGEE